MASRKRPGGFAPGSMPPRNFWGFPTVICVHKPARGANHPPSFSWSVVACAGVLGLRREGRGFFFPPMGIGFWPWGGGPPWAALVTLRLGWPLLVRQRLVFAKDWNVYQAVLKAALRWSVRSFRSGLFYTALNGLKRTRFFWLILAGMGYQHAVSPKPGRWRQRRRMVNIGFFLPLGFPGGIGVARRPGRRPTARPKICPGKRPLLAAVPLAGGADWGLNWLGPPSVALYIGLRQDRAPAGVFYQRKFLVAKRRANYEESHVLAGKSYFGDPCRHHPG